MTEKIVIIGNGFDLRHFLPTSYNHLISILSEIEKLSMDKDIITFSDLFDGIFKEKNEWFYNQINEFYKIENFTFDIVMIRSIQNRLKKNSWFQYFKSIDENKIETWIDFEREIERILLSVLEYFESFNKNEFKSKPRYGTTNNQKVFFIPIALQNDHFKNKLQILMLKYFGLLHEESQNLNISEKFILNIGNEIQYYKERDFFSFLYNSLEEFIGIFNDYIVHIINLFYSNFRKEKEVNFIKTENKKIFHKVSKIYSFNYTNTFNEFYKINKDNLEEGLERLDENYESTDEVEFIHGSVVKNYDSNLENLRIVLGVDDIHDSLKKHKLFQFTKYFQKLHKQTDYLFLKDYQVNLGVKMNKSYIFYFWGHSLDYSDRQYIREVFDVASKTDSIIKIFYHSISAKGDQLKNLLSIINKETIEYFMKNKTLLFIESTPENLFIEL